MVLQIQPSVGIPPQVLDAIARCPTHREVTHCGAGLHVSPFDIYAICPRCGQQIKVRAFSGTTEIEDVFDAVLEWINRPKVAEYVHRRQAILAEERGEEP